MVKEQKLPLKTVLSAIDKRKFDWYDTLSEEEKKQVGIYQMMRYMSSCKTNSRDIRDHYLIMTNELVNCNYGVLSAHPDFQFRLLQIVGIGRDVFHEWIPPGKRKKKNPVKEWLSELYYEYSDDEIDTLFQVTPIDQLKELARDHGLQDKEIKELFKKRQ